GYEERVDLLRDGGDMTHGFARGARLVALYRHDAQPVIGRALLKLAERDIAVVALRNERRRRFLAALGGEIDDSLDIILDQERQKISSARRSGAVGRKGDHR